MGKIDLLNCIHNKKLSISLLNLLILSYFVLISFRSIPDPTHFFIANLSLEQIKFDKLNQIINFIKTPVYDLISFIFNDLLIYNFFSIIINLLFLNILFIFFNSFLNNTINSLIISCLIIFLKFILKISAYFNYEILNFAQYLIMNVDLLENFTVRQIFGIIFLITFYLILKDKHLYAAVLIFINFFTHPNSNLIFVGIIIPFYFYMFLQDKRAYKNVISLNLLLTFIATVIILLKINSFDTGLINENIEKNNFYYNSLIKDEADDFSFLWLIAYKLEQILIVIILISLNCLLYIKIYNFDRLVYFALAPVIIFILGSFVEYLNLYLELEIISSLIINLQPAWKLLGYSFFPFLLILGKNFNKVKIFNLKEFKFLIIFFVLFTTSLFFTVGLIKNKNELKTFYSYLLNEKEKNYEDWLIAQTGKENFYLISEYDQKYKTINSLYPDENNIFKIKSFNEKNKKVDLVDPQEKYDSYKLIKKVKELIPKNSGLILPPYFFNSRGIFHEYLVFYLEHPDGNFAMGNIKFFEVINERMEALLNTNYNLMPNKQSKLNYTYLRQKYLLINRETLAKLKNKYPKYNYIVSENLNIIGLKIIYKDNMFAIYKF